MAMIKKKLRKKLGKKALRMMLKFGQKMVSKHGEKMVAALLSGAAGGVVMAKAEDEMDQLGTDKKGKTEKKAGKKQREDDDRDDE